MGIDPNISKQQMIQPGDKIGDHKIHDHIAPLSFLVKAKKDLQKLDIKTVPSIQKIRGLQFEKAVIHQGTQEQLHWVYKGTITLNL